MPKVQFQNGSLMTSIPTEVKNLLDLKKGETINFNISRNGKIEIIKVGQDLENIKAICIKGFLIEKCDEDGCFIENQYYSINKGEIWTIDNENKIIDGEVRLSRNAKGCAWMEMSEEHFKENFEIIEEEPK